MKRYLVFYGMDYYPSGGMNDFLSDFDAVPEAANFSLTQDLSWGNWLDIYDQQKRQYVIRVNYHVDEKENIEKLERLKLLATKAKQND